MNTTTFENAQVGDRVWFLGTRKWGSIAGIYPDMDYPIMVHFGGDGIISFTLCGKECTRQRFQTLFWDEIPIIAPAKPMPTLEVDTKVLVWDNPNRKFKGHFSHFDEDGEICIFIDGRTSFSSRGTTDSWTYWELAE